jgi:hypothetical protein
MKSARFAWSAEAEELDDVLLGFQVVEEQRMRSRSSSAFTSPIRFDMPRTMSVPASSLVPRPMCGAARRDHPFGKHGDLAPSLFPLGLEVGAGSDRVRRDSGR